MEKISGIIPANARTSSVDETDSPTARPGAPSIGRANRATEAAKAAEEARNAEIEDRVSFSATTANDRVKASKTGTYKNTPENARLKVVDDLAKKFFETNPKFEARGEETTNSEEIVRDVETAPHPTFIREL